MKNRILTSLLIALIGVAAIAQPVIHARIGETATSSDGKVKLTLVAKKQNYSMAMKDSHDSDILSPKSVNVSPDGKKFYVNSLEGGKTVAYDMATFQKVKTIVHNFTDAGSRHLWVPESGLYEWQHKPSAPNTFMGKPVEATFSHNGRYLWVPYYRRTYDYNAVEPSAMAVIDTRVDSIICLFETGPLPKMVATSHDGKTLAVTHWGNNTVGLINIASNNPRHWHYTKVLVVDYVLPLNFGNRKVDRDTNSGYCLRGTAFTPDDRYMLICCMGGAGGVAVIDVKNGEYLGRMTGMMGNARHILIRDGYIYLSINRAGYVQRCKLDDFLAAAKAMSNHHGTFTAWENCKVEAGARTIEISPSGKYIFAACNNASRLCVVDTRTMKMIAQIPVDSYPVGLDISKDGKYVIVTSQGRTGGGGNAVNIYQVEYAEPEPTLTEPIATDSLPADSTATGITNINGKGSNTTLASFMSWLQTTNGTIAAGAIAAIIIAVIAVLATIRRRKK